MALVDGLWALGALVVGAYMLAALLAPERF
jgi:hypothetical protein